MLVPLGLLAREAPGAGNPSGDDNPGGGGSGGAGGTNSAPDTAPPATVLSGKKTQKAASTIAVSASCSEACTASAVGKLSIPGAASLAKTFRIKAKQVSIPARGKRTLKLRLSKKVLAAVKKGLKTRKKVRARITVMAKDAVGNATKRTITVRLSRRRA